MARATESLGEIWPERAARLIVEQWSCHGLARLEAPERSIVFPTELFDSSRMSLQVPSGSRLYLVSLCFVLATGIFLRLPTPVFDEFGPLHFLSAAHPDPLFNKVGFDEGLYRDYTNKLIRFGLTSYPEVVERYREKQQTLTGSILPPVRFLYIFCGYAWHRLFGTESLGALRNVSALFSVLTLLLATIFAARLSRSGYALGVAALVAFAPTQLHMARHALVDGFFTFWAMLTLWSLWENLRAPRHWPWLVLLGSALCALVLTKENAFFVWTAIIVIIAANRWLQFGIVKRELLAVIILGPLLGFVCLVFLAGGLHELVATYQLSVSKNYELKYAILTGDGPWHRYLVDLLLVSPIILLLAIGSLFRLTRESKAEWFFVIFIATSYTIMCNIKYGMNLRYANMWDLPLRILALGQLIALSRFFKSRSDLALALGIGAICVFEFRNYLLLDVRYPLYEMVTPELMRALKILKSAADLAP